MTTNAAIYARYSSDRQRETSIDDQVRICRARAAREKLHVAAVHSDQAVSGSLPFSARTGASAMLADVLAGRVQVVIIESLDRPFRDLVEQEQIVRRLEYRGVRIIGVSDGYDTEHKSRKINRLTRGLINEIYLDDLREKVHRGLTGQYERGLFAGGMAYGYTTIETPGGRQVVIDKTEAKWVRWIFQQYANGLSHRAIAHELNKRKVPAPRGNSWALSALYGSPAKGTGILNNVMYIGQYIWNRSQWVKDPDSKVRKRVERPRHEWKTAVRPELRIVDDVLWNKVRERFRPAKAPERGRRAVTLLGGILKCGQCGGAVVAISSKSYGCAAHHDRGPNVCAGVFVRRDVAELRILSTVRDDLLSPSSIAKIQKAVTEIVESRRRARDGDMADIPKRIEKLDREIKNLVEAFAKSGSSEALQKRLADAEAERAQLASIRKPKPTAPIEGVVMRYKKLLATLPDALKRRPEQAREAMKTMFESIKLEKEQDKVFAVLGIRADRLLMAAGDPSMNVVAGEGFVIYRHVLLRSPSSNEPHDITVLPFVGASRR